MKTLRKTALALALAILFWIVAQGLEIALGREGAITLVMIVAAVVILALATRLRKR